VSGSFEHVERRGRVRLTLMVVPKASPCRRLRRANLCRPTEAAAPRSTRSGPGSTRCRRSRCHSVAAVEAAPRADLLKGKREPLALLNLDDAIFPSTARFSRYIRGTMWALLTFGYSKTQSLNSRSSHSGQYTATPSLVSSSVSQMRSPAALVLAADTAAIDAPQRPGRLLATCSRPAAHCLFLLPRRRQRFGRSRHCRRP
jgi:hypothetical protein